MNKGFNRQLTIEDTQMTNKHLKRCSTLYVIKETKIKTMKFYHLSIRMPQIWNIDNTKCWWGCGTMGILTHCWWEWKWYTFGCTLEDSLVVSKTLNKLYDPNCILQNPPPKAAIISTLYLNLYLYLLTQICVYLLTHLCALTVYVCTSVPWLCKMLF